MTTTRFGGSLCIGREELVIAAVFVTMGLACRVSTKSSREAATMVIVVGVVALLALLWQGVRKAISSILLPTWRVVPRFAIASWKFARKGPRYWIQIAAVGLIFIGAFVLVRLDFSKGTSLATLLSQVLASFSILIGAGSYVYCIGVFKFPNRSQE